MPRPSTLVVPTTFYLETSAAERLFESAEFVLLRRRVEVLEGQGRLMMCTSLRTVEEVISTFKTSKDQIAALKWLKGITPGRLIKCNNAEMVRRWILHARDPAANREACFVHWSPIVDSFPERRPAQEAWRDGARTRHRAFLDHYKAVFSGEEFEKAFKPKSGLWSDDERFYEQVKLLAGGMFDTPAKLAEFVEWASPADTVGITEAQIWEARTNPHLRAYLAHLFSGVVMQALRGSADDALRNDYYDSMHVLYSSLADAMVTNDWRLTNTIRRTRDGEQPRVFMLSEWGAELDRCT